MGEIITKAVIDFGIYSLFVLIYTLVGAYQNINVWSMSWDWKKYFNGVIKWLSLGGAVIGSTVGAFLLLAQAEAQGVDIVNSQALAPRVLFGVMLAASALMLGKIISKLATTLGVPSELLEKIQEQSVSTDSDAPLVFNLDDLPMPSETYVKAKLRDESEGGVGTFYSVPFGSYQEFKAAVNGNGYNIDGWYGEQCWDGAALLWQQLGLSLLTGNGLAIGCWDLKRYENAGTEFDLVTDVNSLQLGDVVCMRPNHIGFFDGYDGNYMRILGQNQGGRPNAQGGSSFNIALISKSAFAGAFRYKRWAVITTPSPVKSIDEVVQEVIRGDWGNGEDRVRNLTAAGYNPDEVQARVNQILGEGSPDPVLSPATISVGDTVIPVARIDYDGTPLTQYDDSYTVSEVNGDRAVLVARGQVWAAMNIADIRKI